VCGRKEEEREEIVGGKGEKEWGRRGEERLKRGRNAACE